MTSSTTVNGVFFAGNVDATNEGQGVGGSIVVWTQQTGNHLVWGGDTWPVNRYVLQKNLSSLRGSMSVLVILGTEMYAGRVACCALVSHVEYVPRALLRLEKGGTDARPLYYAYR